MPSLVSSPGIALNAVTLVAVHETLRAMADELDRALSDALQSDTSDVEVSVEIELPTALAGPAGKALRSVDVAWRLACAITEKEIGELELTSRETVYLDEIAPVAETGLVVIEVEVGSLIAKLKSNGATTGKRVLATSNVVAILATVSGVNVQSVVHAAQADGTPVVVHMVDPRRESVADAIRRELPGLPAGSKVTITGTTPNNSHFSVTLVAPDTTD